MIHSINKANEDFKSFSQDNISELEKRYLEYQFAFLYFNDNNLLWQLQDVSKKLQTMNKALNDIKNGNTITLEMKNLPGKITSDYICCCTKFEKEININDMMIETLNNIHLYTPQLEYESMKIDEVNYPKEQELQGNNELINFHQLLQKLQNNIITLEQIKKE